MLKTRLISKQALAMYNIKYEDFIYWANKYKKNIYSNDTKKEFFEKLNNKIIVRNPKNRKLEEIKNVDS